MPSNWNIVTRIWLWFWAQWATFNTDIDLDLYDEIILYDKHNEFIRESLTKTNFSRV